MSAAAGGGSSAVPDGDALPRALWLWVLALAIVWGLNWPVMKVVVAEIPMWTFRSLCFLAAFAGLLGFAALRGQRVFPAGGWGRLTLVGLFTASFNTIPLMLGLAQLPAGRSVVLYYTMPVWSVLLAAWWLGEPLTRRRIVGVAAGLAGVVLVAAPGLAGRDFPLAGVALVVLSAMSWALGTVLQKKLPVALPSSSYSAWVMLIGGVPVYLMVPLLEAGRVGAVLDASWQALGGVLYNMVLVFILGWWIWMRIVERAPAGVAALSSLLTPVVGVAGGMVFLGERPMATDLAALAAITLAMASVMLPSRRPSQNS